MSEDRAPRWRMLAFGVLLVGMVGLAAELLLLEHYDEPQQWIPLVSLGVGLLVAVPVTLGPSRTLVRALQALMVGYLLVGAAGVYFHLQANLEFELELHPSMAGLELAVEVLRGAMPALAPGAIAQLGLVGLLACYRHPSLASDDRA